MAYWGVCDLIDLVGVSEIVELLEVLIRTLVRFGLLFTFIFLCGL